MHKGAAVSLGVLMLPDVALGLKIYLRSSKRESSPPSPPHTHTHICNGISAMDKGDRS